MALSRFTLPLVLSLLSAGCSRSEPGAPPVTKSAAPVRSELLGVGDEAPDFETVAHTGQPVKLSKLRGKVVILYFYPKDGTPGCTTEAEAFREEYTNLEAADAIVLGVSGDDQASHKSFAEEHQLPFLLLPDVDHTIAKTYGIGSFLGMMSRITYLIGPDGRIRKVYPSVTPSDHAKELLRDVKELKSL